MAKAKGLNIIIIGKDGKLVITNSATGKVAVASAAKVLSDDLIALIRKRQAAGIELAEALAEAKFPVVGNEEMFVIDESGALTKPSKKRKRKRKS